MRIDFNVPPYVGSELDYIRGAIENRKICGDGEFTKRCSDWMERRFNARRVLLTTSGTSALDMASLLCGLEPSDEVILPSFTFSSTATAPALRGARLVFVDIRPDTMNIDETKIEAAITDKTRAIFVVHYAGIACEMDAIMEIARRHNLIVVEDAAQGVMSSYKGRSLGAIGDFGCFSFHETKNYSMGEGGALLVNDAACVERAEILREKGTNRANFYRGLVDKYTWVDIGDSFLPSELNSAYLWAQLKCADQINENRLAIWNSYHEKLAPLAEDGLVDVPAVPQGCVHNAHMYWLKLANLEQRTQFIGYMRERGIGCVFHYIPLHSSPAGLRYGRFSGKDEWTTRESERLVRLPMYYRLSQEDAEEVVDAVYSFFGMHR